MWMLNGQVPIQAIKSTTAYCTPIGGNLVLWKVKIRIVAQSSYEVEYQAMAHGTCELLWLHIFARVVNRIERSGACDIPFWWHCRTSNFIVVNARSTSWQIISSPEKKSQKWEYSWYILVLKIWLQILTKAAAKKQLCDVFSKLGIVEF